MAKSKTVVKYLVVAEFVDKNDASIAYKVGEDVSHFNKQRLAECVKRGLVKKG